ncbi:hypothetical protein PUN28_014013 [Cardiocondyla obscurior]|uniref:Uncharacterized protein n=1 Tax=Cardiocondyla obscurior TaxID=286306 RepID=A0AAW2F9A2_9HYME
MRVVVKKSTAPTADLAKSVELKWEKKFLSFAKEIKREMRRTVSIITQHAASANTATEARKSAFNANTQRMLQESARFSVKVSEKATGRKRKKLNLFFLPLLAEASARRLGHLPQPRGLLISPQSPIGL